METLNLTAFSLISLFQRAVFVRAKQPRLPAIHLRSTTIHAAGGHRVLEIFEYFLQTHLKQFRLALKPMLLYIASDS